MEQAALHFTVLVVWGLPSLALPVALVHATLCGSCKHVVSTRLLLVVALAQHGARELLHDHVVEHIEGSLATVDGQ